MERRYDLDWVRVAAFFLLVLYHVGMYYVSWDWHVKSPHASETLEPLMMLTSPWRLSLLFLVSGVATAFLFGKRPAAFIGQRSWRLLLPLIFGMMVIVTPQVYYEVVENLPGGYRDGYLAFWGRYLQGDPTFCRDGDCLDVPTWNHLWFVAYLWIYTVIAWALLRFTPGAMDRVGGWLERRMSGIGVLVWPALVIAATGYGFIVWYFYFSGYSDDATPPPDALRMLQRVIWAVFQWTAIAAIFGFVRGIALTDSPALRYLREAVFPVYILHQTIIVILAHNAQPLGLRPLVEGPLLVLATFGLSFAGFELVRRVRWLRPLFGLKANPRRGSASVETPRAATTG